MSYYVIVIFNDFVNKLLYEPGLCYIHLGHDETLFKQVHKSDMVIIERQ